MRDQRRQIWIDPVQTQVFLRMVMYSVLLLVAIWASAMMGSYFFRFYEHMLGDNWRFIFVSPTAMVFALLVFIFVYDLIRFTHRFAGPIYRFRKTIRAIADGKSVDRIQLRKDDLLKEMQDDFNDMLETLHRNGLVELQSDLRQEKQETFQSVA